MLRLNRAISYSVHALACIAQRPRGNPVRAAEIAAACHIPQDYLCKVLQQLTRAGLVRGERGRRGGFMLARPAERISLLEIVQAIYGPGPPRQADQGRAGATGRTRDRLEHVTRRAATEASKVLRTTTLWALAKP